MPQVQTDPGLVYVLASGRKVAALPQADGKIVVQDLPLFSVVLPDDPGVKEGERKPRDEAWLREAKRRHEVRVRELGYSPPLTLRHHFDDPDRVGTYLLKDIRPLQVNPDEPERPTIFHDQIFEDRAAFEKAKEYDFRSPEVSRDDEREFSAVALLRDVPPFNKYPNTKPELIETYRARPGVTSQIWARETFAAAVNAGPLSFQNKEAHNMAAPAAETDKKAPSIEERMEACMAKYEAGMAKRFEAMMSDAFKKKDGEPDGDEAEAKPEDDDKPETAEAEPEDKGEKPPEKKKGEEAAARGPDGQLPPAVSQGRQGEVFMSAAEYDDYLQTKAFVKKLQKEREVEQFAASAEESLRKANVDLDPAIRARIKAKAAQGKAAVEAFVEGFSARPQSSPTDRLLPYGAGGFDGGSRHDDPELKKMVETYGARPEVKQAIERLYDDYRGAPMSWRQHYTFERLCRSSAQINPACLGPRGGQ